MREDENRSLAFAGLPLGIFFKGFLSQSNAEVRCQSLAANFLIKLLQVSEIKFRGIKTSFSVVVGKSIIIISVLYQCV